MNDRTNEMEQESQRGEKNLSKNVCSLEMQTPLAIRVTHSYNKCDTIFGCQTFCNASKLHPAAAAATVVTTVLKTLLKPFFICIFSTYSYLCALPKPRRKKNPTKQISMIER